MFFACLGHDFITVAFNDLFWTGRGQSSPLPPPLLYQTIKAKFVLILPNLIVGLLIVCGFIWLPCDKHYHMPNSPNDFFSNRGVCINKPRSS